MHENEIHFAATHQGKIGVFDVTDNQWRELYPIRVDSARAAFAAKVESHMPTEDWCRENNVPCEPSDFEIDISDVVVDESQHEISFNTSFSAYAFGEDTRKAVGDELHSYARRLHSSNWECAFMK